MALGTGMTTPMGMATAYASFANGGYKIEPHFITQIKDGSGNLLGEDKPIKVCGDNVESVSYSHLDRRRTNVQTKQRLFLIIK